jgi:hypothetical protein
MDILEPKGFYDIEPEILKILGYLKYKKYPIIMKGSSSLKSQKYIADYDIYTYILKKDSSGTAHKIFMNIINKLRKYTDTYNMKIVLLEDDEKKEKWYSGEDFDYNKFNNIYDNAKFLKMDFITYIKNKFLSLDCIYYFDKTDVSKEEDIKTLKEDIKEYTKEGRYYKILKRKFKIYQLTDQKDKILELTKFFNSPIGEKYENLNNLEAIKDMMESSYKDDKIVNDRILLNLKELNIKPDLKNVDKYINILSKEINTEAKNINKNFVV